MTFTTSPARCPSRTDRPINPDRHRHDNFARAAVFAEFRARDAKAILDVDFIDRAPDELPMSSPEARFK